MTAPVLFETRVCQYGMSLGLATLNAPGSLNSLTLEMCELLDTQFRQWEADPDIAVVILQGAGDKAFCAGGDLRSLYRSMQEHRGDDPLANPDAAQFFAVEYRLDYLLHNYGKPLLVWGDGIVMGGGMGLMAGASHRVVSEKSRLAMPEISIGLFPDVGGSRILQKMPGQCGLFLGLTGAQIGASDALFGKLADFQVNQADWPKVVEALLAQEWARGTSPEDDSPHALSAAAQLARKRNDALLDRVLSAAAPTGDVAAGPLSQHFYLINTLCGQSTLEEICTDIQGLADHEDPWLARAAHTLTAGSPGSARLTYTLNQHTRLMTLADVFRTEYWVALMCIASGDLQEGIRALLIDKDRQPRWNPASLAQADQDWAKPYFEAPWESDKHPLADLGE